MDAEPRMVGDSTCFATCGCCGTEGSLVPTPAQLKARKAVVRWCRENGIEITPELQPAAASRSALQCCESSGRHDG
jgi:hypothetical protein